jgi:hypothetical protein
VACAGVLGTGLAIIGSLGFISLCGVSLVDIVGAMPFLMLGTIIILFFPKKSLKIRKSLSEAVNRRTDNIMANTVNNDLQHTTQ